MRFLTLLICIPLLWGNTSTLNVHAKAMAFIKKNEGYREKSYWDRPRGKTPKKRKYAICWGNRYLENGKLIKHVSLFDINRCNKIFYKHYYGRVVPKLPKNLTKKQHIAYADLIYQMGSLKLERMNWYPERGRMKLLNAENR